VTKKIVRKPSMAVHLTLMVVYFIVGMPVVLVGIILCLSIVGIAPGIFLFGLAGVLPAAEQMRWIKRKVAWEIHNEDQGPDKYKGRGKSGQVQIAMAANIEYEYDPDLDMMVEVKKPWITNN